MRLDRYQRHAAARAVAASTVAAAVVGGMLLLDMSPAQAQPTTDHSVTVDILNMTPTTPEYTSVPKPLTIDLALTNTTDAALFDLRLDVERDVPYTEQTSLEQLIADPAPSTDQSSLSPLPPIELDTPLAPHETRRVVYRTTTSEVNDGKGVCLCQSLGAVYPIDFTAFAGTDEGGGTSQVGFGQTYLPTFRESPKPVQVSWVWPLIDRPHRLLNGSVFVDDALARSIRPGGRLDRALAVVERVAPFTRLTLLIDPELIDELAVMSDRYQVDAGGRVTTGTGTVAARAWLARLRAIITSVEVSLTPYADPDIDAVTRAGLSWSDNFGPVQLARVQAALGVPADGDVAWPPGGTVTTAALRQLLSRGTSEVVLSDEALPGGTAQTPRPDALARLPAALGAPGAVAAVTDSFVQGLSNPVLTLSTTNTRTLQSLVADLAVRAAEEPDRTHYVVITADRYVNAVPVVAARAILGTARTTWSTSMMLNQAASTITPADHGSLVEPDSGSEIGQSVIASAASAASFTRSFSSTLSPGDATALLGGLPAAIQRTESAAWRGSPDGGQSFAAGLGREIDKWQSGVYIVRPSSGTYTLASNDSPLFVTVVNTLPVDVNIRVAITTVNGVTGFRTDNVRVQRIPSGTRSSLKIQAHVQRAGRFEVDASLLAPDGRTLGHSVRLNIHCTALGAVGVIITAVAGGVLVIALGYRVIRRIRYGPRRPTMGGAPKQPEPAGVGA